MIMHHNICMPICQIQIQEITVWRRPQRKYVPKKKIDIYKNLTNVFGIADEILVVAYDVDCKDHGNTL